MDNVEQDETEGLSLRDEIDKAWEEFESQDTEEDLTNGIEEPGSPEENTLEGAEKTQETAPPEESTPQEETPREPEPEHPVEATPEEPVEVPRSWSKADGEYFKALPPEVQKNIAAKEAKRDEVFNRKMGEVNHLQQKHKDQWGDLERVFNSPTEDGSTYAQRFAMAGVPVSQVVQQYLAFGDMLERDPAAGIKMLMDSRGVTIEHLEDGAGAQASENYALQRRIEQLEQERQTDIARSQEMEQNRRRDATKREIASLAEERDASGNPKHPYVGDLLGEMIPQAEIVRREQPHLSPRAILAEAYYRAAYANPSVRQKMQAAEKAALISQQTARAEKAQTAGSSVSGSPGGKPTLNPNMSLRETIEAAWDAGS